jgi:class 3 adenylate cyclase/HD superfamily phosphodiesterase
MDFDFNFLWLNIIALLFIVLMVAVTNIYVIKKEKKKLRHSVEIMKAELTSERDKVKQQNSKLEKYKKRADDLLYNMLPQEVADDLISKGNAQARHYNSATVMFSDIKGFTKIAEQFRPQDLVKILDKYFTIFDEIIDKYNVEKIKTIGDSYMAVGGVPSRNVTNPFDVVLASLEIQRVLKEMKEHFISIHESYLEIRIGVHTGELIAGVVGKKRYAYDVWGNTVNVAHRMEENGEAEQVNISSATHKIIAPLFETTYRGLKSAKNKGKLKMYYVNKIKEELSVGGLGIEPLPIFYQYVALITLGKLQYLALETYMLDWLTKNLPDNLYYHGVHHTKNVNRHAEFIALAEKVNTESLFLLKTAALFHDAGFATQYEHNEQIGADMAIEILPKFQYSQKQIDTIVSLILSTKVPQNPTTLLEKIVCDADLFYLGDDNFHDIADNLMSELTERERVKDRKEWDAIQIAFLKEHRYFTETARRLQRPGKQMHLNEIELRNKS